MFLSALVALSLISQSDAFTAGAGSLTDITGRKRAFGNQASLHYFIHILALDFYNKHPDNTKVFETELPASSNISCFRFLSHTRFTVLKNRYMQFEKQMYDIMTIMHRTQHCIFFLCICDRCYRGVTLLYRPIYRPTDKEN